MSGRIARSWNITKQSWHVLRQDKHLMVFPLLSAILAIFVVSGGIIPTIAYAMSEPNGQPPEEVLKSLAQGPFFWIAVFAAYFTCFTIVTYFNAALVACVSARFEGRDSSALAGLKLATARLPKILAWAFLSATLGVVLEMLKERAGWIARIFLRGVEVLWTIATFFVVPVLVMENLGPIDAVKRSVDVLRKTWGESLVVQFGTSLAISLITLGAIVVCFGAGLGLSLALKNPIPVSVSIGVGFLLALVATLIGTTLKSILVVACYRYASGHEIPDSFDSDSLRAVFRKK